LGRTTTCGKVCRVIRLTIDDDLRPLAGSHKALTIVKDCPKGRTLLWSAMPCFGGSPWRALIIAQGGGRDEIAARWRDFRILWHHFGIVSQAVLAIDGVVAIAWLVSCSCWKVGEVEGLSPG
jgi:hypothetical protein